MIKKGIFPFESHFDLKNGLDILKEQFAELACLNSCEYNMDKDGEYDFLVAAGAHRKISLSKSKNAFSKLREFVQSASLPVFGILSYDLKDEIEHVNLVQKAPAKFPYLAFFEPEILLFKRKKEDNIEVFSRHVFSPEDVFWLFIKEEKTYLETALGNPVKLNCNFKLQSYKKAFNDIITHIENGDIYEMNFCVKFDGKLPDFNGLHYFDALCNTGEAPFSGWLNFEGNQLVSSSPERFLKHQDGKLLSQPIKGTKKRAEDAKEDEALKYALQNDEKEKAENVMIVDLVRNDLTKVSVPNSIEVTELFGIYSFKQVHQMVSTVRSKLDETKFDWCDALETTFPMGSMTGAPKKRAVELIDTFEKNRREWYSGALGYIEPNGNFDFNVVIRSLLYHAKSGEVSFQAGSAITSDAKAEKEWEECLLKGANLKALFEK